MFQKERRERNERQRGGKRLEAVMITYGRQQTESKLL